MVVAGLLVAVGVALVASLAWGGGPPADLVHEHMAFRIFADGEAVGFPLHNFAVRHPDVHVENDPLAGLRGNELVHTHKAGLTLGDFLGSLELQVAPGRLQLDDPANFSRAVHQGETWADDAGKHWRLYVQPLNGTWTRVAGDPVDYPSWPLGAGERILLTYVPRDLADDDAEIRRQQATLLDDLWRWPQVRGREG